MFKFLISFILFISINATIFGYYSDTDMLNNSMQKTILETFKMDQNKSLILMTDGSVWSAHPTATNLAWGGKVNIENYSSPQPNEKYFWVNGREEGFDEKWREYRVESQLLVLGGIGDQEPLSYDRESYQLEISLIVYHEDKEILILENSTIIVIPSYHRSFELGEKIKIHIMKNGNNAYLIRELDKEELKVTIPLTRGTAYIFMG